MDKKFIRKNQFTLFIIVFFIILLILLVISSDMLFPKDSDEKYGNRLNGIVQVEDKTLTDLKTSFEEKETVTKLETDIEGRIINIIITVDDKVSVSDAKKLGNSTIESFNEEILKDYDIQVFIKKESEAENDFPIIGYRAKFNNSFTWTKERDKKVTPEEE